MDVILTDSIPNLGDQGEVVNVRGGYARNYLIPKGLAFPASSANAAKIEHQKRILTDKRKRQIKTEEDLARRLSETEVKIPMKAGEGDRLFGSVTSQNIADALKEKGFNVDRRKIELEDNIKALGVFTVPIKFTGDIVGNVKVWVVKED